jgi:alpha-galactosidase
VVGVAPSGPACLVGALERGRAFGVAYLRRESEGVAVELELRLDALLEPGETRELERLRVALGDEANALLEDFASAHGQLAGARASAPFVAGWCSWYQFFGAVSETDVLRNLEALAAARDEIPVEFVQIDDGYQRATGDWLATNERFPSGLASLASSIRAAGFTPGIWTAPFCAVAASDPVRDRPEWLLRSGDEPFRGVLHPGWAEDGAVYVLDPTVPAVADHLRGVFRGLSELGFRYFKLDFLYTAAMQADAADAGVGRAARLRRGLDAIREGAGDEAFLLGCGCPLGAAVGVVDGMRVGPDVAPRWLSDPALRIPGLEETLPATRSAVRNVLARAWMHRRLWLNDPDCLVARSQTELSDAEVRTLATAIAATGGMFAFSDDLPSLAPERRGLVRDTLLAARRVDARGLPGVVRALDLLGSDAAKLLAPGPDSVTLAALNPGDVAARVRFEPDALGIAPLAGTPQPLLGTRAAEVDEQGALEVAVGPHESGILEASRDASLAVFCDFDGTFSVQDVGATLGKLHAPARPGVWARFARGEISAWDCNMEVLHGLSLGRSQVDAFLRTVDLDPGARELVSWCERKAVPFRVLSDGFDFNLNRLQQLNGVRFAYDANRLRFDDGRWCIAPGHPNPACGCGTGTCKRGRIEAFRRRRPGVTVVHIGNGRVSDLCGAIAADVAFAKDTLAIAMEQQGHPFEPFSTLVDVVPRLERLLASA